MRKSNKQDLKVLRRTLLAVVSFILLAVFMNMSYAEETSPIEMSSEALRTDGEVSSDPGAVSSSAESSNPLGLGVTPLYGMLKSIDGNKLLKNKFTAGLAAEISLFRNISVEGVFRYAEYDITPDIVFWDRTLARVTTNNYSGGNSALNRFGFGVIGDMRQFMVGGNLKYELFPDSIITPYVGGGMVLFNNDYFTDPRQNNVKLVMPQSVYAVNAIGGLKLKLSRSFSLLCRAEAGTLLNNKNGSLYYYGQNGQNASVHSFHSFRSYDKYMSGLVGMSFGI